MALTAEELTDIARQVKDFLLLDSQGVNELPIASDLEGVSSLPVLKSIDGAESVVSAPISLLLSQMRVSLTHVQWKNGAGDWVNLIALADLNGKSAYDVAVKLGFSGSESQWIASLTGKSAYQSAVENGFVGTEADWIASLSKDSKDAATRVNNALEEMQGQVSTAVAGIDSKVNSKVASLGIVKTGDGSKYLSDDGTYKSVDAAASIIEEEELIGEYSVSQLEYNLYQTTFELSVLPKVAGATATFKVSDRPLGFNVFLEVKSFSVSPVLKSSLAVFPQKEYEIVRVFVDADLCTKIEIKCLVDTSIDNKAIVQLQYVRDFGDIVEFTVTVPSGVDANAISLTFPKLKYNKKNVASLTVDDSYSIYNGFFAVVNKRWVSNEICKSPWSGADVSYIHHLGMPNGINSSTGSYPSKFLEYSDGAGIKHRFACSVAAWCWDLGERDADVGIAWPWISAKEARYMQDFGYTLNYHDIQGIGDWQKANGTTLAPKNEFNKMLKVDADMFMELTDRVPKIMQGPNGDPNYIYMCRTCPTVQYNMEIANRGTDSICVPFKPFNNSYLLDYKPSKHMVQRFFYSTSYNFEGWKNAIIAQMSLPEADRVWQILGMHRMTTNPDENGTSLQQAITQVEEAQGVSGTDEIWFPSIDEVYEYWFMTYYGKVYKTVNGQSVKFKVYAPCGKNFWFRSISCLLSGISSINGVSVVSSDNCFGTSYAMSDGKLLVNLDFNPELPQRAEKYVSILEADKNKEYAYDDAQYFVNMLKPGVKEPFQARIDALVSKPVLNSISINSGATSTENDTVTIAISYSAGTPTQYMLSEKSDLSDGVWTDFVANPTFVLSSGYGSKTVYAKLRNGFGETSIMSDTINYTEPVLNLTSLLINNGDVSTSNPSVVLSFGYVGTATHYMISANTDFSGASWVVFTANPTFVLDNSTFGTKTVYAKLKNSTVETSAVSDSINLVDPNQIALNSVNINNGEENTSSLNVIVSLGVTNTPTHYRIGETSDLSAVSWQAYTSNQLSFALSGYGLKTVYVQLKNATSTSAVLSDSILAVQPVVLNSILINNADVSTDNKTLSVAFSYSGGAPTHYMISESSSFTGASWIAFASSPVSYTLADAAAGNKTVYVKLKNAAGESTVASDTIELTVQQRKMVVFLEDSSKINTGFVSHCGPVVDNGATANAISTNYYASYSDNIPLYDTTGAAWGSYTKKPDDVLSYITKYGGASLIGIGGTAGMNAVLSGNLLKYPDEYYNVGPYTIYKPGTPVGARTAVVIKGLEAGTYKVNVIVCINESYTATGAADPANPSNHVIAVNNQEKTRTPVTKNIPNETLFDSVVLETAGDITVMAWTPLRAELPNWGKAIIGFNIIEITKIA